MNIADKTLWVVSRNIRFTNTPEGLLLLDFERDMYCHLALLAAGVWLLFDWTRCGITVKEIVDSLETAAPLPRRILEVEMCRLVASMSRKRFVREGPPSETMGEHRSPVGRDGVCRLR